MAMARPAAGSRRPATPGAPHWLQIQRLRGGGRLPGGGALRKWAAAALTGAGREPGPALTVRFVGRAESARLNGRFRGKAGATNVLAFPAAGGTGELGDIVICLPLVAGEARERERPARTHLAHLVVHGTLHLLGYDHHRHAAARQMERLETRIMKELGFPDPYQLPPTTAQGRRAGVTRRP